VTSLGNENKPISGGINRTEVGRPMADFYGYVTNGIFQSEYAVRSYIGIKGQMIQPDAHEGDFRFMDLNNDGKIDMNDQTWIGTPWPKLTYGINVNLAYKGFDLLVFLQGSYGNDMFSRARVGQNTGGGNTLKYFYKEAWRGLGTSNTVPIMTTVNNNDNFRLSDFMVQDASYLRLKNLQLGYNLSENICKKIKMSNCRIWVGGTNLLTITKYIGIDPGVGFFQQSHSVYYQGWDWNDWLPFSREFTIGINVSF